MKNLSTLLSISKFRTMRRVAFAWAAAFIVLAILTIGVYVVLAANTANNYTGSSTGNVTTGSNWSLTHVPTVSEDAVFTSTSAAGIKNFGTGATVGSPLTVGSLDVTATTGTYSIRNATTSSTNASITLGGSGDLGNGVSGTAADLLYAAGGSTLQLLGDNPNGSGVLRVSLGQSGNFDAAGTINVSSVISDGGSNFTITKIGSGTLTHSGANTYGGGTTLSAGTLNINNGGTSSTNSAIGTGTFTINGGTISNTSSASVTLATNNTQTWGGDFTFAGTSGTNDLNLGTGAVTLTGNRSIIASGTTSSLTVGGSIGDGGSGFGLTKASGGAGTLILTGASTYTGTTTVSAGKLQLNKSGGGTLASTDNVTINGTGILEISSNQTINNLTMSAGTLLIDSGVTLTITGTYSVSGGTINNQGTLKLNDSSINFPGSATVNNGTANTMNNLEVASGTVTLTSNLIVSGTLKISGGTLDQGASFDLTAGTINISSSSGTLKNFGTGDLFVGTGGVTNAGTINYDGSGAGCGGADAIAINSSDNSTQRSWSGTGSFSMTDVTVSHQGGTAVIVVRSGTDGGGNGANWVFVSSCTAGGGGATYTWSPTIGTDYQVAANWTPTRTLPSTSDTLIFDGSTTPSPIVTNVPTQTIASLQVINGAFVDMSTSAANTLTISGGGTADFSVGSGNKLTLSGANALRITVTSNSTGLVTGFMTLQDGAHQLTATGGNSIITFSGTDAIFTTASNYSSSTNPFGTGADGNSANSSIIFASGSSYFHNNGASPFGPSNGGPVVVFQTGSTANWLSNNGFQANGRTYANLVIGDGTNARTLSDSGSSNFQFDNLTVNSTSTANSTLSFTGSGSSTVTIQGNISSTGTGNGGSLSDITLSGGTSGGITIAKSGGGTISFTTASSRSIDFESNATVNSGTTLSLSRILIEGVNTSSNYVLTINGGFSTTSTAAYVIGNLRKTPTDGGSTTYEVGTANGYSPVTLSSISNSGGGTFTARANQAAMPNVVDSTKVLQRYWTLANGGITSAILQFKYLAADVPNTADETKFKIFKDTNGAKPLTFPEGAIDNVDETTHTATTTTAQSTFSNWSVGEPAAVTLVRLRSFTAKGFNGGNLVEWQTGYEVDNLGFNLYRMSGGKLIRVTPSIVAGSALVAGRTALTAGLSYSWWDAEGLPDSQYYIEDVDLNGTRTMHGPAATQYAGNIESPSKRQAALLSQISSAQTDTTRFVTGYPANVEQVAKMPTVTSAKSGERLTVAQDSTLQKQRDIAAGRAVKIAVNHPGWYRVTQAELVAAGLDPNVNPNFLQLYADGTEQAIYVYSSTGSQLSADGFIEFYGIGMDTVTSDRRTYWLITGSTPGLRVNGQQIKSSSSSVNDSSTQDAPMNTTMEAPTDAYSYTVERKDKLIYFTALLNGEADNFFGPVISKTAAVQDVTLSDINLNTSGPATLEVAVQGVTMQVHKVRVTVNGFEAGVLEFNNQEHASNQFQIPRAYLVEGNNAVSLTSLNGDSDINLADYVRMTYWHSYHADADALVLSSSHTTPITVDGFTSPQVRVFNITDPNSVTQINVKVSQKGSNYSIKIPGGRGSMRLLMALADSQVQHPAEIKANEPSSLSSSSNRADFIILTHRSLRDAVKPLADLRRSQGLETMVVDVEDVYDEFSYGAKSRSAIKDFLETAKNSWTLAPRYVLFVGDASYDPRNYVGFGSQDLVPTKLVDATSLETSSDDALADFDGDGLADMSVGRLPAQTAQQAQSLISKIINFAPGQTTNAALLVSDHLEGYDFEAANNQVRTLLPASLTVTMVNRRDNPTAQVKADIINAINAGPLLVNYAGHGSPDVWTNGAILSSSDIAGLTNGNRLPFFVSMTCLNGRFQDSNRVSLAEALLNAEGGGAIAVWASSGLTEPDAQSNIDQQLMRLLFSNGQALTLGDAVREAKAATNNMDVRRTWIFFGDPTMKLR